MVLGSLLAVDRNQSDVPAESWSHCFSPLTWTQVELSAAVFWMDAQQPATFFHFLLYVFFFELVCFTLFFFLLSSCPPFPSLALVLLKSLTDVCGVFSVSLYSPLLLLFLSLHVALPLCHSLHLFLYFSLTFFAVCRCACLLWPSSN